VIILTEQELKDALVAAHVTDAPDVINVIVDQNYKCGRAGLIAHAKTFYEVEEALRA
jgi:hypothetical protein